MEAPLSDFVSEQLEVDDNFEAVQGLYLERGWTDGLPVVPPTLERVADMLAATPTVSYTHLRAHET